MPRIANMAHHAILKDRLVAILNRTRRMRSVYPERISSRTSNIDRHFIAADCKEANTVVVLWWNGRSLLADVTELIHNIIYKHAQLPVDELSARIYETDVDVAAYDTLPRQARNKLSGPKFVFHKYGRQDGEPHAFFYELVKHHGVIAYEGRYKRNC